jgi:predicted Zn-dependent protease
MRSLMAGATELSWLLLLPLLFFSVGAQSTTDISPNFSTLAAKADAARDSDRLDDALALYRKALALRPAWAEGWWSLGTIEYDQNAYNDAAHAFRKVTSLAPKNGTAYVMLGLSEFELGQDDLSLQHLRKGANMGLDKDLQLRHAVLYDEGVLFQRQGKFEAAQETLDQLCIQGVQDAPLTEALGMVALRIQSRYLSTQAPPTAEVVIRIGHAACLSAQKKFEEAGQAYKGVITDYPFYPNIHYAYGRYFLDANNTQNAVEEFKQEIRNRPNDIIARLQIAAAKYKIDSAGGLPYALEAVKLDPKMAFAHYLLGLLLLDTDDFQKAIPQLEVAKRSYPRDARLYLALASAYAGAGRKQDAARARSRFTQLKGAQAESQSGSAMPGSLAIAPR